MKEWFLKAERRRKNRQGWEKNNTQKNASEKRKALYSVLCTYVHARMCTQPLQLIKAIGIGTTKCVCSHVYIHEAQDIGVSFLEKNINFFGEF